MEPVTPTEVIPAPEPTMRGTFATYAPPDGSFIIAYRPEGEDNSTQIVIPPAAMKMWNMMQAGQKVSPMQIARAFMGGMG